MEQKDWYLHLINDEIGTDKQLTIYWSQAFSILKQWDMYLEIRAYCMWEAVLLINTASQVICYNLNWDKWRARGKYTAAMSTKSFESRLNNGVLMSLKSCCKSFINGQSGSIWVDYSRHLGTMMKSEQSNPLTPWWVQYTPTFINIIRKSKSYFHFPPTIF